MTGNALSTEQYAELSGTISKQLWSAIKGRMNAATAQEFIENPDKVLHALRDGFLSEPELPTLKSNGRTGAEWIPLLRNAGVSVSSYAENVLTRDDFNGVHITDGRTYKPVIIRGDQFNYDERTTKNIRRVGTDERGLAEPPAELAPLLAEKLKAERFRFENLKRLEEEHGIHHLVIMHEAITDFVGDPSLLYVGRFGDGVGLGTRWDKPEYHWRAKDGFIFLSRK